MNKNSYIERNMKTNVIAKIEVDGLHNWPAAQAVFPEVGFLANMHRHKWYITAKKPVYHDDRDVEFIIFGRDIKQWLEHKYYVKEARTHDFGAKSCEMLAKEIMLQFDCVYVSVFEDNENGAEVYV